VSVLTDRRFRTAAVVAVVVLVADQVTKAMALRWLVLHEPVVLLPGAALTLTWNTGAAFGLLAGLPAALRLPLFLTVTAAAAVALVSILRGAPEGSRWQSIAVGGIFGGALGNLVCRLRFGAVVDFVELHWRDWYWPTFNVADSAISIGIAMILLHSLRHPETDRPEVDRPREDRPERDRPETRVSGR
jgi:signal peptidase II